MSKQPTPDVSAEDVERILRRDFPDNQIDEARRLLQTYGTESWHRETHRVRLAALKLAAGDVDRLRIEIDTAGTDYRDVLAPAEYPEYFRRIRSPNSVSPEERRRIIDADWKQYSQWLARR